MKFKKEYRWLFFLVVPFVVFMITLFMIPLQIIINSQPLATQSYNIQKGQLAQHQLRSATHLSYSQLLAFFSSRMRPILDIFSNKQNQFSIINVQSITLNNAYSYYHKGSNSEGRANRSMWFAGNTNNESQLTSSQGTIYQNYRKIQPTLQEGLPIAQNATIVGVYSFYDVAGTTAEDMAFFYPSYQQNNYSSLNYTIDQSIYQRLLAQFQNTSNTLALLDSPRQGTSEKIVSLCQLRTGAGVVSAGFTCLDIDVVQFNKLFSLSNINSFLITPNYFFSNSTIIDNITSGAVSISRQELILSHLSSYSSLKPECLPSPTTQMMVTKLDCNTYYLLPLYLYEGSTQTYNTFAYYLTQYCQGSDQSYLQSAEVVNTSLNNLLIPTIILILLSLVLSVIVLRFLINSIDLQLHQLNECCKFILDGDLGIEIPEYKGTKDIFEVYEQVKIINKLHRYTSKDYFVGHFSNRIFKYNEALEVVRKLRYDPSNLMENIGEAYLYIEEYDKSIHYLKESVRYVEQSINDGFGGLDKMVLLKQEKERLPSGYKEYQLILIRRLWKLVFCCFKYVELQIMNAKQLDQQNLTEAEKAQKKERLQKETLDYIGKLKKAMFPDFKFFAQSIMLLNFEIKFLLSIKNFQEAKDCLVVCDKVTKLYNKQYDGITKRLKEKGSKNLYFFRKNKLSGHSRASPNIMDAFYLYTKGIILANDPQGKDYLTAVVGYLQGLKKNIFSHSVNYLLFNQIKKVLGGLKVSMERLETTQLFRQSMPYKTLYYGPMTKEIEPLLYRIARNPSEVESREYVIFLDASYYYSTEKQLTDQLNYLKQRSQYLYDKLIKNYDRVSLVQSNSAIGVETLCSLTLKQSNEVILKKSLTDMTNYKSFTGRNQLILTLQKIIFRIKNLQCQKVVVVFLKYISSYTDEIAFKGKTKTKSRIKRLTQAKIEDRPRSQFIEEIGDFIEELMSVEGLRNCKLLLMCATSDEYYGLINKFGMRDINKRIWSHTERVNKNNNVVYIIDEKHKSDLDRILMSKIGNVSDNHVFAL